MNYYMLRFLFLAEPFKPVEKINVRPEHAVIAERISRYAFVCL